MPKKKPEGTISHQIFLSEDLHKKITTLAGYGKADHLIVECVTQAIEPRWKQWVEQEHSKLSSDPKSENGQGTIRRSSPPHAEQITAENREDKSSKKGKKT